MSRKPDKAARRKAKLKAKRVHAEQLRHQQHVRIADALMDLCADVLPEYVDDSRGIDLVGRNILRRMGMVAWNIAVTGRREIDESSINTMKLDEESRRMVRDEVNALVRLKYKKYPDLRTSISNVSAVNVAGGAKLKVSLGDTFPAMPIPDFSEKPEPLTPEQILTKRKGLKLSQVKFAAALGVSVKTVSAWEHGKAAPTEAELEKIRHITA
ncbi:MAG: helix-turn-helix domain-containing protein [Victivallales bacterium]|nr:helix-turn-helix domain-containing protein [Victivallales bacterium]